MEVQPISKKRKDDKVIDISENIKKIKINNSNAINDPFKEPFKYPEFRREIVYRNNTGTGRFADVYYYLNFIFEGQVHDYKFRSLLEIPDKCKLFTYIIYLYFKN